IWYNKLMDKIKVILIPGNGGSPQDNWFPYLERELSKLGIRVINKQFPDPALARQEFWLPFIKELGADENTVLIGHSSGAIASTDDPFIPIEEPRIIHQNLNTDYHEYTDQKHFGHGFSPKREFPELIELLKQKVFD